MTHEKLLHIDLFSGIGGFALATDRVFGEVEHIFCDNEPFAQEVLKKHWPTARIYGDIRSLTYSECYLQRPEYGKITDKDGTIQKGRENNRGFGKFGQSNSNSAFILTGGFPCQPFSQAGRRRGEEDDRFLWPEMLRVIREFSPLWVIAENVRGLLTQGGGVVFERVCTDLEAAGYEVQPLIIPAVAVGAPHRRDRVWFVAHRTSAGGELWRRGSGNSSRSEKRILGRNDSYDTNTTGERRESGSSPGEARQVLHDERIAEKNQQERQGRKRGSGATDVAQNAISKRGGGRVESGRQVLERESTEAKDARPSWETHWLEVATRLCGVDDGIPYGVDGFKLSKAGHRVARLKGLGNAIVPQVAEVIMRAIKEAEEVGNGKG